MTRTAAPVSALLEEQDAVAAFDRALKQNKRAVLEHRQTLRQRYAQQGVTVLPDGGWPLRPLFVPRRALEFLARALHRQFDALRRRLIPVAADPTALSRHIPLPSDLYRSVDMRAGLRSRNLLSIMRPDGFLLNNGFLLTEVNFGNGAMVSNAYSETLFHLFAGSPAFKGGSWAPKARLGRPFAATLQMIRARLAGVERPRVALLAHHWEHKTILGWEPRVIQQLYFAQRLMQRAGIRNVLVNEEDLVVDRGGVARTRKDNKPVDAVVMVTIGTSFMDEPHRLLGDLKHLRGSRVGRAPLIKPLASLCMDKGTMPFMHQELSWPCVMDDWFHVDLASTAFPVRRHAAEYRLHRERYVLKRAFDGKDTVIGVATGGRQWNAAVDDAVDQHGYVIQEYVQLPRTTMPISPDGKHIEWVQVRVELSPFIVDGRYAGAIARFAPDAEGIIMSPPPPDMGMTCVYAV